MSGWLIIGLAAYAARAGYVFGLVRAAGFYQAKRAGKNVEPLGWPLWPYAMLWPLGDFQLWWRSRK